MDAYDAHAAAAAYEGSDGLTDAERKALWAQVKANRAKATEKGS